MLKNYFKIALRSLWKNKWFTGINIIGLALGIATCLLIMVFVQYELSYDKFHNKTAQIVRVTFQGKMQGGELKEAIVMAPVAKAFKNDFPEVLEATRLRTFGTPRVTYKDKLFREDQFAFADSNFFRVFTIPFIKGNPQTALQEPNSIILSAEAAHKFFGNEDPLGKMLEFKDNNSTMKVTGVFDRIPANSHFRDFGLIASMSSMPESGDDSWMASHYYTYLLLPEGYDYKKLEAKLPQEVDKYIGPQLQTAMGITLTQFRESGNSINFYLQPVKDIHLHSDLTGEMQPAGDMQYVYIFSAVALFMLLIACINFMNLSTAGAAKRAREVGIRKVMGSLKKQLVKQFLLESLILTVLAMCIALFIVYLVLPVFSTIAGKDLTLHISGNPWTWFYLAVFAIIISVLAGSYPAFFLSSFNPIAVLKGRFTSNNKGIRLRKVLVVFQFFISISLIMGTAVVWQQLSYIRNKKLGYTKEQVIVVEQAYWLHNKHSAFKQQLLKNPLVQNISASGYLPAGYSFENNFFVYPGNDPSNMLKTLRYDVDENYIPVMNMQLAAGRNFSSAYGTDSTAIILNEVAAKALGWQKEEAIGQNLTYKSNDGAVTVYHVIGIVKDFHFRSLHQPITPLAMTVTKDYNNLIVKTATRDVEKLLSSMKQQWESMTSEAPFTYSFLDDRYYNTYKAEQTISGILGIFAGLTIFVACLGLFGLATFTAEQRTKEIGIRKVLGANVTGIVSLLSKEFVKLVAIAFVLAVPVGWLVMNRWLQEFAYRIQIQWWMFLITAVIALLVTLLTVGFRAIRAALTNPVATLRSE